MVSLKEITNKIMRKSHIEDENSGGGLYVTLNEMIEQKKYVNNAQYIKHKTKAQMSGDVKSIFKGRGIEFEEIRLYEFGDEVRDIDWKVTARKGVPYSKLYAKEHNRDIYVFLDLSSSMVFGSKNELKSVAACKFVATVAWMCLENKDRFGCMIFDGSDSHFFKANSLRDNILAIFKKISQISEKILLDNQCNIESYKKSLVLLRNVIKSQEEVLLVSDFVNFSEDIQKIMAEIGKNAKTYFVNVYDSIEGEIPKKAEYKVSSLDKNLVFSNKNDIFLSEYSSYFVQKRAMLKDFCHKVSASYIPLLVGNSTNV